MKFRIKIPMSRSANDKQILQILYATPVITVDDLSHNYTIQYNEGI